MRPVGELSLLIAFVASGFAAFACIAGWRRSHRGLRAAGVATSLVSLLALTVVGAILSWALLQRDFSFAYVARYSSIHLSWQYSLSALWVGQAGSLWLWAWLTAVLAAVYGLWPRRQPSPLREPAFGVVLAYVCFLIAIMVFAADPMEASLATPQEGAGLSPTLQHPAMLIHPPIVFLGYSLWTIPFALVAVALTAGPLGASWVREARPWALGAWMVLGAGILWGADWAYEELGWGGYWGWDPVENGSLIPWLTGTALVHALMAWQYRGALKKTAVALAIATFGLCNFATFLTRSGIFSSLHAFSKSPIGWLFLALMVGLAVGGGVLLVRRRSQLAPNFPMGSVLSREAFVLIAIVALLLLTGVVVAGTLSMALSGIVVGRTVMLGNAFYNNVLIPTGLVFLVTSGLAPLLSWGEGPTAAQKKCFLLSGAVAGLAVVAAWSQGLRHPVELAVWGVVALAAAAVGSSLLLDGWRRAPEQPWLGVLRTLRDQRRQYAGFVIHLGLMGLAVGLAGSSLRTHQQDVDLRVGQTLSWAGHEIKLARILHRQLPDKLVAEAELELSRGGQQVATLLPARHFHLLQREWSTEVAIHSAWRGDVYTILHGSDGQSLAQLTLVENPLIRWLWLGGVIMGLGTLLRLWPTRRRPLRLAVPRDETIPISPPQQKKGLAA